MWVKRVCMMRHLNGDWQQVVGTERGNPQIHIYSIGVENGLGLGPVHLAPLRGLRALMRGCNNPRCAWCCRRWGRRSRRQVHGWRQGGGAGLEARLGTGLRQKRARGRSGGEGWRLAEL